MELCFQGIAIATLSNCLIEWPRNDSTYSILDDNDAQVLEYIEMSIAHSKLVDSGTDEELKAFVKNEERKFLYMIESEEWTIIDSAGNEFGILAPIFHPNNYVVWMER